MKAIFNDVVIADSNDTVVVEGNHYFPPNTVDKKYLEESRTHTTCPWKGEASYYHVKVNGEVQQDAAWYYPNPKDAAKEIRNYIAFWKDVEVQE
ncbi:DUF427 domain-containing protein [Pontibacter korlensis]|uniref:DUF427 domain-containing protein n=1 Tax=Pontibacter korlensis TaxID=400092 RepID=A0A0E3ZHQ5_9BACT|nr:DUF427 domain-containing protein [Pontibacter korlensis]AKD05634.1 hypothetical protein PKOR_10160 [Pontibacter korlensis]